jgi:hypothetical protein
MSDSTTPFRLLTLTSHRAGPARERISSVAPTRSHRDGFSAAAKTVVGGRNEAERAWLRLTTGNADKAAADQRRCEKETI